MHSEYKLLGQDGATPGRVSLAIHGVDASCDSGVRLKVYDPLPVILRVEADSRAEALAHLAELVRRCEAALHEPTLDHDEALDRLLATPSVAARSGERAGTSSHR